MPEAVGGDAERLVVLLEARIRDFEKNMQKAEGTATRSYAGMRKGSRDTANAMEADVKRSTGAINRALDLTRGKVGVFAKNFAAGFVAPLAGALSLTAAINGTKAALDKFGDIADKAAAAGVNAEFFQGIAYQAGLSGVEVDGLAGALATFAKNAGMAAEGKGRMVTAFKALDPELLKSVQAATTQEEKFLAVADAIKNTKDAAQAAAIASAAFGDQGVKLVAILRQGGDELERAVAKAKEMGIVIDNDVIARADELGDQFDTITTIIDQQLKQALVNLGPVIIALLGPMAEWVNMLNIVLDGMRQVEDRQFIRPLQNELIDLQNNRYMIGEEIKKLKQALADGDMIPDFLQEHALNSAEETFARMTDKALQLQERIAQLQGKPKDGVAPVTPTATFTVPDTEDIDRTERGFRKVRKEVEAGSAAMRDMQKQAERLAESIEGAIGDAFSSLLDGPIEGLEDAMGRILGSFTSLGQQNLSSLFSFSKPANDNGSWVGASGFAKTLEDAVRDGTQTGFGDFLKNVPGGMKTVSAGLGGLGIGYSAGNPLMGALGGGLQGFAAGGPLGAAIGAIGGLIGGIFAEMEAREKARKEIEKSRDAIEALIATGLGQEVSEYAVAFAQFNRQIAELVDLAQKAGDTALVARLKEAQGAYKSTLGGEFLKDLQSSLNSLRGDDHLNRIAQAQERYNQRLRDAAFLGVSAEGALEELNLTLAQIAEDRLGPLRDRVDRARSDLSAAYQREASRLTQLVDRWKQLSSSLRDFISGLRLSSASPLSIYDRMTEAQRQFQEVAAKAMAGDEDAMAKLTGVSQAYLDASKEYYASSESYLQIFTEVEKVLGQALAKAEKQVTSAELELQKLDALVAGQIDTNKTLLSVEQALRNYLAAKNDLTAAGGFDASTYWSPALKALYATIQDFKAKTGSTSVPIANFWNDLASPTSAAAMDAMAQALMEKVKALIPGYAAGTSFHPGGLAIVGEEGPEVVAMGRGAQVIPTLPAQSQPANDNAQREITEQLRSLNRNVEHLIAVNAAGASETVQAVSAVSGAINQQTRSTELVSLQRVRGPRR